MKKKYIKPSQRIFVVNPCRLLDGSTTSNPYQNGLGYAPTDRNDGLA